MEVTRVNIVDNLMIYGEDSILKTFYLIHPDEEKLNQLKQMIEHRLDYQFEDLSDEEIKAAEAFNDNIWNYIYDFVENNFEQLEIHECEIEY